jgi:hypothetical protein
MPQITSAFLEYAQARGFHLDPARVRHPRDKGRVERAVPTVRDDSSPARSSPRSATPARTRGTGAARTTGGGTAAHTVHRASILKRRSSRSSCRDRRRRTSSPVERVEGRPRPARAGREGALLAAAAFPRPHAPRAGRLADRLSLRRAGTRQDASAATADPIMPADKRLDQHVQRDSLGMA